MAYLPRGIAPELLLSQVKNTMPYVFDADVSAEMTRFAPAVVLRNFEKSSPESLDQFEYFRLCLSCHYLTCGTPVPTDVDNQIRLKLWPEQLPIEDALRMADLVLESRRWDFTTVTSRFISTPEMGTLSGHLGEWFTVSSGAYCALKQYSDPVAAAKGQEIFEAIADEVRHHSEIFGALAKSGDGLGCLKASASIAHNFGDLDRVMDMWDLAIADPLRLQFYKLGTTPFDTNGKLRYFGRLWIAGELYKSPIDGSSMALENHRHFALRKPKCLRQRPEFLIPTGPFFDDWARRVARGLATPEGGISENTLEVVEALKHGSQRLAKTVGYRRALKAMLEVHPRLVIEAAFVKGLALQDKFEKKWNDEALVLMDDIPSRA